MAPCVDSECLNSLLMDEGMYGKEGKFRFVV